MGEKITKEDMYNHGKIAKFYPPWRRPFRVPSFYVARWLVNHGLNNPQRLSYAMIILSFIGAIILFSNDIWIRIGGWCILILAYFIDMMDGKTSRMLNKPYRGLINYLDNQFHAPMTSFVLFVLCFRLYMNTGEYHFILLGFFLPWIFLWKPEMQLSYLMHMIEVNEPKNLSEYNDQESHKKYHNWAYKTTGWKKWGYICIRPFLDATDIWFAILPVMLLRLDEYYLYILLGLHGTLLFWNMRNHIKGLKNEKHER